MKFISLLSLLFILLSSCVQKSNTTGSPNRNLPNIIWLVAEDQSPDWFPMYGDSTMALPHLQALANDGVVFDNAVAPVPVCAPARSALITGMYPTTLGTHNMRTYAPGRSDGERPYPELDIPSYSPVVPYGVKMFPEYLRKKGYYTANGPKEDYNFEKTDAAWNESSTNRHWRKRENGQPFFVVFNFNVCHESQVWNRGKDSLFTDPAKVPVPPYFPDTETVRHDIAVNYSNLKRLDDQVGKIISELKTDGLYENSIIFFYGDHGGPFPRHKRALYDTGVKVPLIIKFPGNSDSGQRDQRNISFIDYAPTVLSLAGIDPPKVMQGKAQFGAFKTEQNMEYTFHSSDRFDAIYDCIRAVRSKRFKYIKSFNTNLSHALPVGYREQMPMMQELRILHQAGTLNFNQDLWLSEIKPEEELYDVRKDPYELHNLAGNKDFKDTLSTYRELLNHWIAETKDLGQFPEKELIDSFLVKGKQPELPSLEMNIANDSIQLLCKKSDASLVWKQPQDTVWNVYSHPLPAGIPYEAKAERIGYRDSEIFKF